MTTATAKAPPTTATQDAEKTQPRPADFFRAWLNELGNIPLHRIMIDPPIGTATEDDFLRVNRNKQDAAELVAGTLIRKPMGQLESAIGYVIGTALGKWQEQHMPGVLTGEQSMLRMSVGNIRMPDVAFYPKSQFPDGRIPREKIGSYPALLAVEVLSESNTSAEIDMKIREYFDSGTKLVWIVDPATETVRIYDAPTKHNTFRQIGRTDTLDGSDILPNFAIAVADIFNV